MIIYDKFREFLSYVMKKRFSLNINDKKEEDINSEFFRKLHPHKGDEDLSSYKNDNNEINSNNFEIRNYIELEMNMNTDEAKGIHTDKSNMYLNEEKFIRIEIKDEQHPVVLEKVNNCKEIKIDEKSIHVVNKNKEDNPSNSNENK